ncbi:MULTISPECIES: TRAP transporter small permease [unclassified Brevibacterium]|uniref:TRAP transporter small permease n=1 Tax=unclassified Brevibacterium TaxID=2614124 RepID=UPI0010923C21|nr:TRAP transporter small permease [Brevibacterium sp. S22]TGD31421.1 TRAP transporter small permease [Brevibacterium sp. S22]
MRVIRFFEDWVVIASFMIIVIVTFVNVLSRYIFKASLAFSEELTINFLVVMTMMGAVVGIRLGAHLGFTYLVENAKGQVRKALLITGTVLIVLFLAVLLIWGGEMTIAQGLRGRATPSLGIPQWLFTLSIPLAGLLGIVRSIQALRTSLHEDTSAEAVTRRLASEAAPVIDDAELSSGARSDAPSELSSDSEGGRK